MILHSIHQLNQQVKPISRGIWDVFQVSYQIEADIVGATEFPPLKRTRKDIQTSTTQFYGIINDEKIVAVIEIELNQSQLDICSLVVHPSYFRQGMAGHLLDYVIDKYQPTICVVETAALNEGAIKLYNRKGFVLLEQWMTSFDIEKVKLIRELKF